MWRCFYLRYAPGFTDAEVRTIALMQPVLELSTLKKTYLTIYANIGFAFPLLISYKRLVRRSQALGALVGHLMR